MIKPPACNYKCPSCKWEKIVAPKSDALILGVDVFESCPKCGNIDLEVKRVGLIREKSGELFANFMTYVDEKLDDFKK